MPPRILLVKRAAHETAFPNSWELPGGHVEQSDSAVQGALFREIKEETGLVAYETFSKLNDMAWSGKTRDNLQLNYVVTVQPPQQVVLDPEEHSDYAWVSAAEVKDYVMTSEMKKLIDNALSTVMNIQ